MQKLHVIVLLTLAPFALAQAEPAATTAPSGKTTTKAKSSTAAPATTTASTTLKAKSQEKVTQLPVVIVTAATRNPQAPDTTATSTTVVTHDELIDNRYDSVVEALMKVPGLAVVQSGAPGQPTSVFIRGNNSNATLYTIDGRRQATNLVGSVDFGNLTLDNVNQIEVVRTPSSSLQGGNSAGGVINLVSLSGRGMEKPLTSASFEGGSYDYFRGQLQSRGAYKDFDYAVSGSALTNDNNRFNENQRNYVYRGNFGYQITPDVYVDLHTGYSLANAGAPNSVGIVGIVDTPNPQERIQSQDWFVSPEIVANVTDFFTTKLYFNYDQQRLTDNNPYTDFINNFASYTRTQINTTSVDWQNNFQVARNWKLTAGIQGDTASTDYFSPFSIIQNNVTNIGGYIESEWQPLDGLNVLSSIRDDEYSDYAGALSWRQGVSYRVPQTQTLVHASGSSAYTPPSAGDLYFPLSPNLKPSTTLGWEAGVAQPFLNGKVNPSATYFHNNITDLIVSFFPAPSQNVGQATTDGVELNLDVQPLENLSLNLNYTYLNAVNDTNNTRLVRRPRNSFNFTATYNPIKPVTLTLGGSWVVDRQDIVYDPNTFTTSQVDAPDYFVLRAAASWKINDHLTVWSRGENITNTQYQPVLGYPALGAALYGGLKVSF